MIIPRRLPEQQKAIGAQINRTTGNESKFSFPQTIPSTIGNKLQSTGADAHRGGFSGCAVLSGVSMV